MRSSRSTSTGIRASSTSCAPCASATASPSIQDACEALGARYKGEPVGSQGLSAVFAFYPNKQITTGEGGMITTHSEREWRLVRSLRNQGRADSGGWLEHARLGFNYRIDDIRAAIGIGQLEKLDAILQARARWRRATGVAALVDPRARAPVRRRRGPRALLVRLRRDASGGCGSRGCRSRRSPIAASRPRAICRASISSRTCRSGSATASVSAPSPRTSPRARSRCRSTPASTRTTRRTWRRRYERALE